jgi:hypothetical protein
MTNWIYILAASSHPLDGLQPGTNNNPAMRLLFGDFQAVFIAALALAAVLVLLTLLVKKRRTLKRTKTKIKKLEDLDPSTEFVETRQEGSRRKIKYRRRRRAHRSRNPSLAETGGLPPPRDSTHSG